jgi:tetratricopeptide (TPR) repeat protein
VTEDIEKDEEQGEDIVHEESPQEEEIVPEEDLVSVAHIFADTDIIPFSSPDDETVDFFDLAERINEELEAIEDVMSLQKERISSTSEKPLQEIIKEFKKDFSERMHEASDESRYNLGIAFMEQGLYDEAIDEFKLASRESFLTVDCFLSISFCFRNKKNLGEAIKWVQKAMDISEKDSTPFYSLKYELASLFEAMGEHLKAMQTFIEVKEWKSDFRDVGQRLKNVATKIK